MQGSHHLHHQHAGAPAGARCAPATTAPHKPAQSQLWEPPKPGHGNSQLPARGPAGRRLSTSPLRRPQGRGRAPQATQLPAPHVPTPVPGPAGARLALGKHRCGSKRLIPTLGTGHGEEKTPRPVARSAIRGCCAPLRQVAQAPAAPPVAAASRPGRASAAAGAPLLRLRRDSRPLLLIS